MVPLVPPGPGPALENRGHTPSLSASTPRKGDNQGPRTASVVSLIECRLIHRKQVQPQLETDSKRSSEKTQPTSSPSPGRLHKHIGENKTHSHLKAGPGPTPQPWRLEWTREGKGGPGPEQPGCPELGSFSVNSKVSHARVTNTGLG
uniref:Uncharacterized protein n=1 Tax=Myotis myotis TaxID=51298 RepID=A0A7J7VHS9_MYOMY|nr:hypothetical protein mMyoMyo1_008241 [Myotis myotis]